MLRKYIPNLTMNIAQKVHVGHNIRSGSILQHRSRVKKEN